MSTVVLFSHGGVRCAVPARQVVSIVRRDAERVVVDLFGRRHEGSGASGVRAVSFCTPEGPCHVPCDWSRFAALDQQRLHPLPQFLDREIDLPFVVGISEVDGELTWLIDMSLFVGGLGQDMEVSA